MRVLLTTQPGHGHFRPLLPVAHALVDAGHDVRVGTSASFGPVVEREGFAPVAVGLDWLHGVDSTIPPELKPPPEANTLETFFAHKFVRMTAEQLAADAAALADRWRPDLIVRETTEFGGSLAAEMLGLPSAAVQVASPSLMSDAILAAVADVLDELRPRLGLAPDPGLTAVRNELVMCFAPPALHDPTVPLPAGLRSFRPASAPASGVPPDAIAGMGAHRPLVYATLGTVFNDPAHDLPFFPAILGGLGDAAVDLLIAVGPNVDPASLGAQRPGVRVLHMSHNGPSSTAARSSSVTVATARSSMRSALACPWWSCPSGPINTSTRRPSNGSALGSSSRRRRCRHRRSAMRSTRCCPLAPHTARRLRPFERNGARSPGRPRRSRRWSRSPGS